jgi:lysozyme family protein
MADFDKAHKYIIKEEGGYQDMPNDTGNYTDGVLIGTNYGISADTLKSFLGRTPTKDEMENLSFDDAVIIYIQRYWSKILGDRIKNQSVALLIYDGSVNQGRGAMRSVVGNAMRNLNANISDDKVFSEAGIKKLNSLNQQKLFEEIYNGRKKRYEKGQVAFRAGHLKRLSGITFNGNSKLPTWAIISISLGVVSLLTLSAYRIYKK